MAAFDNLKTFGFAGYKFPVRNYSIRGAIRDHVHEYPHSPGGAPEKLGRRLYEVRATALFVEESALPPAHRNRYGSVLFTRMLNELRAIWETQKTDELVLPHIGSVQAYAIEWDERSDGRNRSGVEVDLVFREDQDTESLAVSVDIGASTFPERADTFASVVAQLRALDSSFSLFAQINAIANSIIAIKDQSDLYGNLIASKIAGLDALLRRADKAVPELDHPDNIFALEAFLALWDSTRELAKDTGNKGAEMQAFVVPVQMSVGDVSSAIYGTPGKGTELMALNPLDDPLEIPAGTKIRYYPLAA